MGITSKYQQLSLLLPRDVITETWGQRSYQAACAEYEALWDATAPGGSVQVYAGHDHTPQGGGGPINRGSLWSACSLDGLFDLSYTNSNQARELSATGAAVDTAQIHPSPGLRPGALLTGWICYYARNSDRFRLEMSDTGTVYDVDLPIPAGEKVAWHQFALPVTHPGQWRSRNLFIRCGSYDASNVPVVTIYALQIDETPTVLGQRGRPEIERPAAAGNTILVGFPRLDDALVAADEWLDSYTLGILYQFGNGLYEGIEEKRAPGAAAQTCRGHDHDASNYGGRALARGGCYTASLQGGTYLYRIAWNGLMYMGYQVWDLDDGINRRSLSSVGMALFWVGPGLTSSGSAPANPPYLTVYLYVEWDAGAAVPTMNIRARNLTTMQVSAVTTISATSVHSDWVQVDKVPCSGDAVNELQWEIEMTGTTDTVDIDLYAATVYEVPGVGARTNTSLPPLASGGGT